MTAGALDGLPLPHRDEISLSGAEDIPPEMARASTRICPRGGGEGEGLNEQGREKTDPAAPQRCARRGLH